MLRTAVLLREETDLLDTLVDAELEGRAGIAIARLAELPPALARLIVIRLAEDAAGTFVRPKPATAWGRSWRSHSAAGAPSCTSAGSPARSSSGASCAW